MTHYRSHQLTAMKIAASAGNMVIVNLDDVRCESVTAVPTGECAGTGDVIFIGLGSGTLSCWERLPSISTDLTPAEKARMFPVMPSEPPLNRADRRALKFKKGNR